MKKFLFVVIVSLFWACKQDYSPKPRGYFRIDFPEKEYQTFSSTCPFTFEYPSYGRVLTVNNPYNESCWYDVDFPEYKAKIHLTYKQINHDLASHIEDVRAMAYKHVSMANAITENLLIQPENRVFGTLYYIGGNTASSLSFFVTDSTHHFLSGSLYFSATPNSDSLAPAIQFFQQDVVHLTESINWE